MEIKVLGPGCAKCNTLEAKTKEAVEKAGVKANITKVEDIMDIMAYGIAATPALVINEKVIIRGRVPSTDEIIKAINQI